MKLTLTQKMIFKAMLDGCGKSFYDPKSDATWMTVMPTIRFLMNESTSEKGFKDELEELQKLYLEKNGEESAMACFILGFCYNEGLGVTRDFEKANDYFKHCATQSYHSVKYVLEALSSVCNQRWVKPFLLGSSSGDISFAVNFLEKEILEISNPTDNLTKDTRVTELEKAALPLVLSEAYSKFCDGKIEVYQIPSYTRTLMQFQLYGSSSKSADGQEKKAEDIKKAKDKDDSHESSKTLFKC